jgi:hypothetical protein
LAESITLVQNYRPAIDVIHLFVDNRARLLQELPLAIAHLTRNGMLWVSWPKKSAQIRSDISEDTIRDLALPAGLVDIKVCSVTDELWSGLKLVWRKTNQSI